jgi:phosphoserine phosphatase
MKGGGKKQKRSDKSLSSPQLRTVICVDLDGTLIREASHHILLKHYLKHSWGQVFQVFWKLATRGRAAAKACVAQNITQVLPQITWTPNRGLIQELMRYKGKGVKIILVTGAPDAVALFFKRQFAFFDDYLASSSCINLVGKRKLNAIHRHVGPDFIYVGNSYQDIPIWRQSQEIWGVTKSPLLKAHVISLSRKRHVPLRFFDF